MDLSKNKHFSTQEAINCICRIKKKKGTSSKMVPLGPVGLSPPECFQFCCGN